MDIQSKIRDLFGESITNGWSIYKLAKESGIPQSTLQEYISKKGGELRGENLGKAIEFFGVRITGGKAKS